ncbi:MAG: dihydropteroate synthase [Methylomonas sp.]
MIASTQPQIMGILNVTPDSFSDGGKYTGLGAALRQAATMIAEGADIIDVGGESTRPGSLPVGADEQIERVMPVIAELRARYPDTVISIDTTLSKVAAAALHAGANMINDVSAGLDDAAMLALAAASGARIILMHRQGAPLTMQDNPFYQDVAAEVQTLLTERIEAALAAGVKAAQIIIDPGIGFGKRKQDNLALLAGLDRLTGLGYPVLLGASRKRFMGNLLNVSAPEQLVTATAVTTALGVMAGVRIFRVHDVMPNRQAAEVAWAILQAGHAGKK